MSWKHEDDRVTVSMTLDDWERLVHRLGYAAGNFYREGDDETARETIRLTNRLNEGNPHYRPYRVPDPQPMS